MWVEYHAHTGDRIDQPGGYGGRSPTVVVVHYQHLAATADQVPGQQAAGQALAYDDVVEAFQSQTVASARPFQSQTIASAQSFQSQTIASAQSFQSHVSLQGGTYEVPQSVPHEDLRR